MTRKTIKDISRSGGITYGLVESIRNGLTTVILMGSSRRMTNLRTVDPDIEIGEMVIVDQTITGIPFVRRKLSPIEDAERELADASLGQDLYSGQPYVFSINRVGSPETVGRLGWSEIEFDNTVFDDDGMFSGSGSRVVLPKSGVYLLLAQIGFSGTQRYDPGYVDTFAEFVDYWKQTDQDQILFQIRGSSWGVVVQEQGFPIDADPVNIPSVISAHGMIVAEEEEEVWVQVYADTTVSTITLDVQSSGIYPKFSGYRLNRTNYDDESTASILDGMA
jgi:hypothetical protein